MYNLIEYIQNVDASNYSLESFRKCPIEYCGRRKRDMRQDTITVTRNELANTSFANMLPHCPYLRADKLVLLCERHFLRLHHRLNQLSVDPIEIGTCYC